MKLLRQVTILFFIIISAIKTGYSQTPTPPICDSLFLVKINTLISDNEDSKTHKQLYTKFLNVWETSFNTPQTHTQICNISHNLQQVRKATYNVMKLYIEVLISFSEQIENKKNFPTFHKLLDEYCNNSEITINKINNYMIAVKNLLDNGILFDNPQTRWKSSNTNFLFTVNNDNNLTVTIPKTDLTCYAQDDSITIFETSGNYNLGSYIFEGDGGKITWERSGFPADSVFARFGKYGFELSRSLVIIDSVDFYNHYYFDYTLKGTLRYQAAKYNDITSVRFPKFESYQKQFTIKNLYEKVDYYGGYIQSGSQFIGSGNKKEPATLSFWKQMKVVENEDTVLRDIVVMRASSDVYTFTKDKVMTNNAVISIYLDKDSIYHPGLNIQYFVKSREVNLLRNNDLSNMSRSPYFNSYHMVEIEAEMLKWNMNDTRIIFSHMIGSELSSARFESYNYFSSERFYKLQGISTINPLFQIRDFALKINSEEFYAEELARYMMFSESKIRQLLIIMSFEGYVYYDKESKLVTIRQKLYDYIMAATRTKDYDVIAIKSDVTGNADNAFLELKNFDLNIHGIHEFEFSRANRINARPKGGEIILKKDREIQFDGELRAGLYHFYGKKFRFNYAKYNIELENVDSLLMEVSIGIDLSGHHKLATVRSKIEDIKGIVHIDNPGNKSGIYEISRFPVFESTQDSYVYYDSPDIQGGAYNRDSIYFKIDPYRLDSLNNPEAEKVKLTGVFNSGNIFPKIRQELTIMKDYSLGFRHDQTQSPISTYGNRGQTTGYIEVSNQGIKAQGQLDYLRTSTWSYDFTFYLDSMNTTSKRFLNQTTKSPSLPLMEGNDIYIHWEPYNDKMLGKTTTTPLDMFNSQSSLTGTFTVEPLEITGNGTMDISRSKLKSEEFKYTELTISADVSSWSLATADKQGISIKTDNVKSFIDFETRIGKFTSNDPYNIIQFPVNQYIAYADELNWNIDNERLGLSSSTVHSFENQVHRIEQEATTTNPAGCLFVSVHPRQDSLNFISPLTDIDLNKNILYTQEVKFINVADATVIPGDGNITIDPEAKHRAITNAQIIASRQNKYHTFYDATVNLSGRLLYSGNGHYDYIDEDNNKQQIKFTLISVQKDTLSTYATGQIRTDQTFNLNQAFGFIGKITLLAEKKYLQFDGYTKLLKLPEKFKQYWVQFNSEIVPENVLIPVDSISESINKKKLYHSLITNMDSTTTYTTFYSETTRPSIHAYTSTPGYLKFDRQAEKYETSSQEKLTDKGLKDNYVSLNTQTADFFSSGKIKMVRDLGQVKLQTRGQISQSNERKELIADLFMTINFFFNDANLIHLADTLNKIQKLGPINTLLTDYEQGMTDLIGNEAYKTLIEEQKLFGLPKTIPPGFSNSIVFTDLNMRYDTADNAFKSFGKIGIGNILDRTVNKFVDGCVEIRYVKSKAELFIYLEPAPNHWYFFKYANNSMLSVSSDAKYNGMIEQIKLRKRRLKAAGAKYTYYLTYPRVKDESLFYFKGGKRETQKNRKRNNNAK